jgi:putative FmdB family regulatory protein
MPIYEYNCAKCGKTIEVIQKFSDKPLKKHDKCGGTLTKLLSASSFHLKGTGWYKTDYASSASPSESKETSTNGKKEGGEPKTEALAEKSAADKSATSKTPSSGKSEKPKSSAPKS